MTGSPESLSNVKSGAGSPSRSKKASSQRRAVGVVRVSRVGTREGERFVSPSEQRERIAQACERDGLRLVDVLEELDVSGGATLAKRTGLRLRLVESGEAEVLVVAYFDRLVRSLRVQEQVLGQVEAAGGAIVAVDVGEIRADTASRWASSTMLGMVAEYHRRVTAERTQDAKRRAVARGVAPFPKLPPGYRPRDRRRRHVARCPAGSRATRATREFRPASCSPRRPPLRLVWRAHGGRDHRPERQDVRVLSLPADRRLPAAGHDQR